jgi:class 3 adenylate cyclase
VLICALPLRRSIELLAKAKAAGMTTRRLAAIMAADIAGYSRLMHADE